MVCRLYFGKVIKPPQEGDGSGRPNRFFNSANFPLDVARYRKIQNVAKLGECHYHSVEDITSGMGQTLGLVHWRAGFDARDVEFIMGGASFSGVELFMIDFNQVCFCSRLGRIMVLMNFKMRPWNRTKEEIPQLVEAFFVNDPYYPRPRVADPLYQAFKSGYMSAYPTESAELGEAFLRAIEAHQATSDRGQY
jgi:hypothetical protein